MGTLYIVATPIGNLKDITLRALEALKSADVIFAEDTRVTAKLLAHYAIAKPLRRYDEHSHARAAREVAALLKEGKSVALTTDAGTPGIADPGARLVAFVRETLPAVPIIPIPGPAALTAALSVAGVPAERFTFLGYPPHKKGRASFFGKFEGLVKPIVLYESPHRLLKTLASLGEAGIKEVVILKELTKLHEEVWRGTPAGAAERFREERGKGEFVLIVP